MLITVRDESANVSNMEAPGIEKKPFEIRIYWFRVKKKTSSCKIETHHRVQFCSLLDLLVYDVFFKYFAPVRLKRG